MLPRNGAAGNQESLLLPDGNGWGNDQPVRVGWPSRMHRSARGGACWRRRAPQEPFGAQLYELKTTLIVTYFVPESSAPLAALATLGLGWFFLRRRVR